MQKSGPIYMWVVDLAFNATEKYFLPVIKPFFQEILALKRCHSHDEW